MPAPEVRDLIDYAVLWAATSTDGYGRSKISAPVEIRVRWEDSREESTDPQNTVQASPATVFVGQAISIGSVMWHGRLKDLPTTSADLFEVTGYKTTPDIKNRFMQRTVTLTRHGDVLPETAV